MREFLTKKELVSLTPEVVERLQNRRLVAAIRHLAPHTPFYARFFQEHGVDVWKIRRVEDWQKIPLVRKIDYMKSPKDFIVSPQAQEAFSAYRKYNAQLEWFAGISMLFRGLFGRHELKKEIEEFFFPKMPLFSGGTEYGQPVPCFITAAQKKKLGQMLAMVTDELAGLLPKERPSVGMNLFPYGPHLAWHAAHAALEEAVDLNLCTAAGGAIPTERLVALASAFKPVVFTGMVEYFRHRFLQVCREKKVRLPKQAVFVHGATMLLESERELVMQEAKKSGIENLTVLNLFGASELKEALLPECAPGTGFHHINPLASIIRTVKIESAEQWEFSEHGSLALWTIDGAGTLLLGYVLGDHAERVEKSQCQMCGLKVQRFFGISRAKDVETQLRLTGIVEEKVKGARLNLVEIRNKVLSAGAKECRITINRTKNTILIEYAVEKPGRAADKKIQESLSDIEVKPKFKQTTLQSLLQQQGYKYKPIVII